MMTFQGHVRNGVIVPDEPQALPDGTAVQVQVLAEAEATSGDGTTLLDRLKPFVGSIDGLPEDASINLKHYLYGHPKR